MQDILEKASKRFILDGSEATVGRDKSCTICISGVGVSRFHAILNLDSIKPVIKDNDSTCGIRLNGSPTESAVLTHGDLLTIGAENFRVDISENSLALIPSEIQSDRGENDLFSTHERMVRIGREADNELPLSHPLVSRLHATVRREPDGTLVISDNKSTNGTFVNGKLITQKALADGDIIQIGPYRIFVDKNELYKLEDRNQIKIEASDVTVMVKGNRLIDNVSMSILPGEFVVILGPSGAGKSTLVKALTGFTPINQGEVYVNGLPLKKFINAFTSNIGYVSQENLLYQELTVEETFREQSMLRLPADCTPEERLVRIRETVKLLELEKVLKHRIQDLSGGEAKRVHIGIELLSSPALIVLDEPLSNLDPGLVCRFMKLFRRICDRGHSLLLTTHTLEQLEICDRIVFMDRGKAVFIGSQDELKTTFKSESLAEVYENISNGLVSSALKDKNETSIPRKDKVPQFPRIQKQSSIQLFSRIGLLVSRYLRILSRDYRSIFLIFAQTPVIALCLGFVFNNENGFLPLSFYFCVTVSTIWIGGVNTIRDISREWNLLSREYRAGLPLTSYISSKLVVAFILSILQAGLFGGVLKLLFDEFPFDIWIYLLILSGIFAGGILGLCISAFSKNADQAVHMLPIVFIPQIFFSGILIPFDRMTDTGRVLSHLTISRPVFSMFKESCLLHQDLMSLPEWKPIFVLCTVLIILTFTFVGRRVKLG